jgi:hypothetical protein
VQDLPGGDEFLDRAGRTRDGHGPAAQVVGRRIHHDPPPIDHQHVFQQVRDLVDQMGGQQDGAGVLGVIREQSVEEDLPGHRVKTQVRLVEQGDLRPRGQPQHDADGRMHAPGQLLHRPIRRQLEIVHQLAGQLGVPIRVEPGRGLDHPLHLDVRVQLAFLHEHHAAQYRVVLQRVLACHQNRPRRRELLSGQDFHQRRLAGAVAPEQPGDGVGLQDAADVVESQLAAVAAGQMVDVNRGSHDASPPCG